MKLWIAVCVGHIPETGRLLASCLTVTAPNRFQAIQLIGEQLPQNENWVAPDGTTRPYELFTLEQCPPREAELRVMAYAHLLQEIMQGVRPPTRHSA